MMEVSKETSIAIVPARGGSKRIPRKNIRSFCGAPIIKYSIDAAIQSNCFSDVIVSTDDDEIAAIARELGASIPFMRSSATASDEAPMMGVLQEVLNELRKLGRAYASCCCILPTAPFITPRRILEARDEFGRSNSESLIVVTKFDYPIQRALTISDGLLEMIWPENLNKRSQDLVPSYRDAGLFYWMKADSIMKSNSILNSNTVPLIVDESEAHDIDTEEDWRVAELKYQLLNHLHSGG